MHKIGYFSTSQQITFGKKGNNKIFKINIFNDNKKYLVPYNGNIKGKIIIKIQPLDDKYATIIEVIGLMIDQNLLITLQYFYNIFNKSFYIKQLNINHYENNINRLFIDKYIFSIDPINCNDIDDAMSYEETDTHYIISVYIAQPITYLTLDDILKRSTNTFTTLYNEPFDKNKNLWGDLITIESSLLVGKVRNVYAIIYHINKVDNMFDNIIHYPAKIINKLKTNYDECLSFDIIKNLYHLTMKISSINNTHDLINDTHDLINYWMVKTNYHIGNSYKLPYRVIKKSDEKILSNLNNLDNNINIKTIFINKLSDNAYYSFTDNYHAILDKLNYTHMTSPIRRVVDTIIHWCITYNINITDLNIDLDKINNLDKSSKKYHNNIKLLNYINNLIYDTIYILDGWIYKNNWEESLKKNKSIKIIVFIKELGFQKVELWNSKFNYLINNDNIIFFDSIKIGNKHKFEIKKKNDFLPINRIFIKLL